MDTKVYKDILNENVKFILKKSELERKKLMDKAKFLFGDGFLWNSIVKKIVSQISISCGGMVFAGPEGCGKHSAAAVAISEFINIVNNPDNVGFLYLTGSDFDFNEQIVDADTKYRSELKDEDYCYDIIHLHIESLINGILDEFGDVFNNKFIVVMLDDIQKSECCELICKWVAYNYNIMRLAYFEGSKEYPRMFVFILTDDLSKIPHFLREELILHKMDLPDESERKLFISNYCKFKVYSLDEKIMDVLINESANLNYMEIKDLVDALSGIKTTDENVVKKLVKTMLLRPMKNVGVPVVNSGAGDSVALLTAVNEMMDKKFAENQPHQLILNNIPDGMDSDMQGFAGEKPDPEKIKEDAKNQPWNDILKYVGVDFDETVNQS